MSTDFVRGIVGQDCATLLRRLQLQDFVIILRLLALEGLHILHPPSFASRTGTSFRASVDPVPGRNVESQPCRAHAPSRRAAARVRGTGLVCAASNPKL